VKCCGLLKGPADGRPSLSRFPPLEPDLILDQRGADMADLPGGASGLLVRDYKGKEADRLVISTRNARVTALQNAGTACAPAWTRSWISGARTWPIPARRRQRVAVPGLRRG
jgi:hypothetical protein